MHQSMLKWGRFHENDLCKKHCNSRFQYGAVITEITVNVTSHMQCVN
jgi:hypothetical protein